MAKLMTANLPPCGGSEGRAETRGSGQGGRQAGGGVPTVRRVDTFGLKYRRRQNAQPPLEKYFPPSSPPK
ncbi:hypothetical protein D3Y55_09710 [Mesorhizobium sp. DCY119]|nr:hypothetical protein D3Y55_09710 [Mesorhizobium sp. DCY119]